MTKKKLMRITTVPSSLKILLKDQLKFMRGYFDVIAVSSPGPDLRDVERNEGVRICALEMSRKITPFKDLLSLMRMYRLMVSEKPDIVHTHTPKAGLIGMTAARLAGVRHRLHTVAGMPLMETDGFKQRVLIEVEKFTYRCATLVLPNSHGLKDYIVQKKFIQPGKLKIIGNGSTNGVNLEHFSIHNDITARARQLRTRYAIGNDSCVFLFVGRIVKDKGINELADAFTALSRKHSGTKLLLVGHQEADLDPISSQTQRAIENNPDIIFCGFQADIRPYLAMSDIFVFPSYREGFPNVLLQACGLNLPCIATDINGNNEVVEHGVNGLLIEPKNTRVLFKAMEDLLCDKGLRRKFSLNARERVLERYAQSLVWQELLGFYKELFNS